MKEIMTEEPHDGFAILVFEALGLVIISSSLARPTSSIAYELQHPLQHPHKAQETLANMVNGYAIIPSLLRISLRPK